jgi:hypothetical protein
MALEESIPRFFIVNLSKRFTSIPVGKIASYSRVNYPPDQTLQFVQHLITSGELNATIHPSPSTGEAVLRFTPTFQSTMDTEPKLHDQLATEVANIQTLAELVRLADAKLLVSRDYVTAHKRMVVNNALEGPNGTSTAAGVGKNMAMMEERDMQIVGDEIEIDDEDIMLET